MWQALLGAGMQQAGEKVLNKTGPQTASSTPNNSPISSMAGAAYGGTTGDMVVVGGGKVSWAMVAAAAVGVFLALKWIK